MCNVTEQMIAAAKTMLENNMDYWPDQYAMTYPEATNGEVFCLVVDIDDSVWLMDVEWYLFSAKYYTFVLTA